MSNRSDRPVAHRLDGATVLVTRPSEQAVALCETIEQAGGAVECLPLLEIEAVTPAQQLSRLLADIDQFDVLIFVSRNAVQHGLMKLHELGLSLPGHTKIAAVGRSSAKMLEQNGCRDVVYPTGISNSEELLECEPLKHVSGCRILIFRGQEGREVLADTLSARGAMVEYAPVYRRVPCALDYAPVLSRWLASANPVLVLTSIAATRELLEKTPLRLQADLVRMPVAVLSERIREFCVASGWRGSIAVSDETSDEGLLATIAVLLNTH